MVAPFSKKAKKHLRRWCRAGSVQGQWGRIWKKLDSFTLEISKNHLIRNFLRIRRLWVKLFFVSVETIFETQMQKIQISFSSCIEITLIFICILDITLNINRTLYLTAKVWYPTLTFYGNLYQTLTLDLVLNLYPWYQTWVA